MIKVILFTQVHAWSSRPAFMQTVTTTHYDGKKRRIFTVFHSVKFVTESADQILEKKLLNKTQLNSVQKMKTKNYLVAFSLYIILHKELSALLKKNVSALYIV